MDIFEQLRRDHRSVLALIDALRERRDDDLVLRLRSELTAHLAAEELVLYQRIRNDRSARDAVNEAVREHQEARSRLSAVFLARGDGEWPDVVRALRETVEGHVRREEERVFPLARRILALDDDELLARRYHAARGDYAA